MIAQRKESAPETAEEWPVEIARSFGNVPPRPFEHAPERVVLSSEAHSHLAGHTAVGLLSGPFAYERIGVGTLTIEETDMPGQVHVHADVRTENGPIVHLDADVRKSWLNRTAETEAGPARTELIVSELLRLLEVPRQSTVTVSVD